MINPYEIIHKLYIPGSLAHYYLVCHGEAVAKKALEIADRLEDCGAESEIDRDLLYTGAMLHDIGIIFCDSPSIGCTGKVSYKEHGILGSEYLKGLGFPELAFIAERHFIMGVTVEDIKRERLPFPERDMMPASLEEKIICFADKFHSKVQHSLTVPKNLEKIISRLPQYAIERFIRLAIELKEPGIEDISRYSTYRTGSSC